MVSQSLWALATSVRSRSSRSAAGSTATPRYIQPLVFGTEGSGDTAGLGGADRLTGGGAVGLTGGLFDGLAGASGRTDRLAPGIRERTRLTSVSFTNRDIQGSS